MTAPPPSLRERKARRTRDAIVAAAIALFDERGYDETSVVQIAERAEVGTRTFFRYFADKEEVLFGEDDELLDAVRAALRRTGTDDGPVAAAVRAARTIIDRIATQAELLPARERIVAATPALQARSLLKHARYGEVAEAELAAQHGLPWERSAVLARVVLACTLVAYRRWCADPAGPGLGELLDRTLREAAQELAPFG